jgi:antitoxin component of RelBE/YafQ-DinJ toxin-antitoxin module
MSKTANIRARVEPGLKTEVENILSDLGLTVSEISASIFLRIFV